MSILRLSTLSQTLAIAVITLGLAAVPALADPPSSITGCHGEHKPCDGVVDGGRDETFYNVGISGLISGGSTTPWRTFGKETSIGLNDSSIDGRPGVGVFTALSFLGTPFTDEERNICFPLDDDDKLIELTIHQGNVREGRGGRAQAGFFFDGSTHSTVEGSLVTVLYHLLLTGDFEPLESSLPPITDNPVVLSMLTWELTATNEGKAVKSASCIGEGTVDGIAVTVDGPVPEVSE